MASESKSPKDIRVFNGDLVELKVNFQKDMKHMIIHSIKLIEGGSNYSRTYCLIDHDEGNQTIFEIEYIDQA